MAPASEAMIAERPMAVRMAARMGSPHSRWVTGNSSPARGKMIAEHSTPLEKQAIATRPTPLFSSSDDVVVL